MRVVAYVPDLLDRSRLRAVVPDVEFVALPQHLSETAADVAVVDLNRPGAIDVLSSLNAHTIGFASHVERELLEAARAAGCRDVLVRSAFFRRLPELLSAPPEPSSPSRNIPGTDE